MDKKDVLDKAFDEILYYAVPIAVENMMKKLPECQEVEFSDSHKLKMEKLFKQERRKLFFKKLSKLSKRVAIFAVIAIIGVTVSIFSVEAWRVNTLNTILEIKDTFGQIDFYSVGSEKNKSNFVISYIPNDFECVRDDTHGEGRIFRMYENEDKHFSISVQPVGGQMAFDTEGAVVSDVEVNGKKGILSDMSETSKKYILLIWYDDTYCYSINGNISTEEILKIAENINLK
jgi:cell division protein FtsL